VGSAGPGAGADGGGSGEVVPEIYEALGAADGWGIVHGAGTFDCEDAGCGDAWERGMPEHAGRRGDVRAAVADGGGAGGECGARELAAVGDLGWESRSV